MWMSMCQSHCILLCRITRNNSGMRIQDKPATSTTIRGNVRQSIRMSTRGVLRRVCSRASPFTPPITRLLPTVPSALWRLFCRKRPPSTCWDIGFTIRSEQYILLVGFRFQLCAVPIPLKFPGRFNVGSVANSVLNLPVRQKWRRSIRA